MWGAVREVQEEEVSWREGECPYCGKGLRRGRTLTMHNATDEEFLLCGRCGVRWLWDEQDRERVEASWGPAKPLLPVPEGTMLVKETT